MVSILRVSLGIIVIIGVFGFSSANPVTGEREDMAVDHNNNE